MNSWTKVPLETGDWLDWSSLVEQTTSRRQVVFHFRPCSWDLPPDLESLRIQPQTTFNRMSVLYSVVVLQTHCLLYIQREYLSLSAGEASWDNSQSMQRRLELCFKPSRSIFCPEQFVRLWLRHFSFSVSQFALVIWEEHIRNNNIVDFHVLLQWSHISNWNGSSLNGPFFRCVIYGQVIWKGVSAVKNAVDST